MNDKKDLSEFMKEEISKFFGNSFFYFLLTITSICGAYALKVIDQTQPLYEQVFSYLAAIFGFYAIQLFALVAIVLVYAALNFFKISQKFCIITALFLGFWICLS